VLVGRQGNQVYLEILDTAYVGWPCGTPHPNGFRYAFLLTTPGAKEMLATALAAQTSGKKLLVVGTGTCSQDPSLEDVSYVVLQP
jgi:hypothetical protein